MLWHVLGHGFERVIDNHPTQPYSMTMEKWKERKDLMEYLNDRTWPYHGMSAYAMKMWTSVLNHTSDKYGLRGDMSPYVRRPFAAVPKSHLFLCDGSNGQGGRME